MSATPDNCVKDGCTRPRSDTSAFCEPHQEHDEAIVNAKLGLFLDEIAAAYEYYCPDCKAAGVLQEGHEDPRPDNCLDCESRGIVLNEIDYTEFEARRFRMDHPEEGR